MDENRITVKEGDLTKTICYSKEFMWEIENFVDWWSSRPLAETSRNDNTTWEEEVETEEPKNWDQAAGSPFLKYEINGVNHQFRIDILKFDSWDRFDDDHSQMMGISLFYAGPEESIAVKPLFWVTENDVHWSKSPNEVLELKRGEHSYARIYSDHSIASNLNQILNPHFQVHCSVKIKIAQYDMLNQDFKKDVRGNNSFNRSLHHDLDFTVSDGCLKQSSDFEIVCANQKEDEETFETTLHCHKIVLCLGSEYYRRMFSGSFVESKGKVVVTDISSTTMIKVLKFIYTGFINEVEIDVDVLYAADKYEMAHLHALVESKLQEKLNIETVFDLTIAANNCGSKTFQDNISRFLCRNWKKICEDKRCQTFFNNAVMLRDILNQM